MKGKTKCILVLVVKRRHRANGPFLLVTYSPNFLYSRLFSSPRRPGPDGEGGVEAWDGMTPLHLACEGGLDNVVQRLVEHKVNVNSKVCHRLKKEKKK